VCWWVVIGICAFHALGTAVVTLGAIQLATQDERLSRDVAARLEAEGVMDPDRKLNALLAQFS
jgi:hypothetical protein